MNDFALTFEHVNKTFGNVTAVRDLSLKVPPGMIYGFLGPNGAGKTTSIRMVMNIFHPDSGEIRVLGADTTHSAKDRLGYLPEEKGLYRKMRVGELVAYFGRLKGMPALGAKKRAHELLERFGLGDYIHKRCESLSKGMSQKVQILVTLIHNPELVILDEPFSGLDPVNVEVMRDIIVQMKREGRTVIFSTRVMEQAEQICDSILLIDKGEKVLDGPLFEIKKQQGQGILLDYDGDGSFIRTLPGVVRVNDAGKQAEIFLAPDADSQGLLSELVGRVSIHRFDIREPSLHEIFVRTVRGEGHE
ncbi:MAG: ATP-binding cassette domain-containing protein [Candidatus Omnitrophica bacterium]|nr:ATP-binding cassette domain-containing protein [Candidatus Omnitrophota bacterium]